MTDTTTAPVASSAPTPANANASPKKKTTTKTPKAKSSNVASHPKYSEMVKAALKALNERSGSSRAAILKFVLANYSLDPAQANQHLKLALKNGVKSKLLKQTKGNGASGSFKLAAKTDSPATKKKTSKPKKPATSSTGANASATKKRPRSKSAGTKPAKKVATSSNVNNSATADASAAKPKKAKAPKAAKPRSSATPKSANAAKATKKPKPSMSNEFMSMNNSLIIFLFSKSQSR